ncbi:MAG: cellulase family glycosylhydrolase [Pseudomonadota bacterium]
MSRTLVVEPTTAPNAFPESEVSGYFHTSGSDIVTEDGQPVQLIGANWFGAEGSTMIPNGLWARNYRDMMDEMAESGINTLRIPISPDILTDEPVSDGLHKLLNPDLAGKTPIEVMDAIVDYASQIGIRIILDMHRIGSGVGKQEDGLWFSDDYSVEDLASDWGTIAGRYAGNPTVIGADVFNEPSGKAHWGDEDQPAEYDWAAAAEHLGNAILDANPDLLILVQGVHIVDGEWYWVGGNLSGAGDRPIELDIDGRLVYSPHDYPYSVQNVPWLEGATPEEMVELFREHWGYLAEEGQAPILIGETGGRLIHSQDEVYFDALFGYLSELSGDGTGGPGVTWWGWNPNSGDTGGILDDDWRLTDTSKLAYLHSLQPEMYPTTQEAQEFLSYARQSLQVSFGDAASFDRIYDYTLWLVNDAGETELLDQSVLHFRAGDEAAIVDVVITTDMIGEGWTSVRLDLAFLNGVQAGSQTLDMVAMGIGKSVSDDPVPATLDDLTVTLTEISSDMSGSFAASVSADGLFDGLVLAGRAEDSGVEVTPFLTWADTFGGTGAAAANGSVAGNGDGLDVSFTVDQHWGSKMLGRVTVTNTTDQVMSDWGLSLRGFGFDVAKVHKASAEIGSDGLIEISGPSWKTDLAPGESIRFGFDAFFSELDLPGLEDQVNDAISSGELEPDTELLRWSFEDGDNGAVVFEEGANTGQIEVLELDAWQKRFVAEVAVTNTGDDAMDALHVNLSGKGFWIDDVSSDTATGTFETKNRRWELEGSQDPEIDPGEVAHFTVTGYFVDDPLVL